MKWEKSPQELIDLFDELVPDAGLVERRKMFGYPCAFANGNMFFGLHQRDMILRLSDEDREAFLALEDARQFEPMPGRAMKEYAVVPEWLCETPDELQEWIGKSLSYAASLPPKVKKT